MKQSLADRKKIIFFGLGSIGKRLARLTKKLYPCDLYALRSPGKEPNSLGIEEIYNNDDIGKIKPDIAFITNPTSLHLDTARYCASEKMHMFIEKPFSNYLEGVGELLNNIEKNKLITYIGCQFRFDPIILHLKSLLKKNNIFYSKITCSSYLPEWRPEQDYRSSYSAKKDMGGGVILDLIHESDYSFFLFGPIAGIEGNAGKKSSLEIDTEDYADITMFHKSGTTSQIHLDYFSRKRTRKIELYSEDRYIEADLLERTINTDNGTGTETLVFEETGRDDLYIQELDYFFSCIDKNELPMNDISEHIHVLRPILEFKQDHNL